jgi:hypothetical protein
MIATWLWRGCWGTARLLLGRANDGENGKCPAAAPRGGIRLSGRDRRADRRTGPGGGAALAELGPAKPVRSSRVWPGLVRLLFVALGEVIEGLVDAGCFARGVLVRVR